MDPNAEGGPPKAPIDTVEVEVEVKQDPAVASTLSTDPPGPPIGLPGSSSIFRDAFRMSQQAEAQRAQDIIPDKPSSSAFTPTQPVQQEPEDVQRMHEEEFERRLKGDYIAAQQRLGSVVRSHVSQSTKDRPDAQIHENMDRPLRLSSIRLHPAPPTTRSSFLNSLLSPFLSPSSLPQWLNPAPPPPKTLHEVLLSTRALVTHLDKFGVFDLDQSSVRLENKRGGDADEVELVLGLKERGRLFLKAGTEVGGGEGGGNITARLRNALGGGESLEGQASVGTKTKSAYSVSLSTPLFGSPLLSFALSGFSFDRDNTAFASHRELAQGGRAKLSAIAPWGLHDLQYEYIARDITHLLPGASVSVRELAQPSTKSALSHTYTRDTRDDPWLGTRGQLLKITHEYAGLPGSSPSAHFFKSVSQSQLSRQLYSGSNIHFSISSLTSMLFPLSSQPTELPDRLFLGGPNSVRGWKVGGVGLHDGQDSLGGELAWGAGLSVFAPFYGKAHWPIRAHGFLNAGKVVSYDRAGSLADNTAKMFRNPNLSAGLGIMYRLDPIRIEVNFTMPLIGRKGERTARGFGIGVGLEFL